MEDLIHLLEKSYTFMNDDDVFVKRSVLSMLQCRERLYEDVNGVGIGGVMDVPVVDYTREILGIREEGDGMSVATLD